MMHADPEVLAFIKRLTYAGKFQSFLNSTSTPEVRRFALWLRRAKEAEARHAADLVNAGELDEFRALFADLPDPGAPRVAPLAYLAPFVTIPAIVIPYLFFLPLAVGFLARRQLRHNPMYTGRGRALFAIVCGWVGFFLTLPIFAFLFFFRR